MFSVFLFFADAGLHPASRQAGLWRPVRSLRLGRRVYGGQFAVFGGLFAISGDQFAFSGDLSAISGGPSAISGDQFAISGDQFAFSGDQFAFSGDQPQFLEISSHFLETRPHFIEAVFAWRKPLCELRYRRIMYLSLVFSPCLAVDFSFFLSSFFLKKKKEKFKTGRWGNFL